MRFDVNIASRPASHGHSNASRLFRNINVMAQDTMKRTMVFSRRRKMRLECSARVDGPQKVVGMGSVGMDFLASVSSFPRPDDKMRTENLDMQGGGNCGNAMTATARLGTDLRLQPTVVSKIGCDAAGDAILSEFREDTIDTTFILRSHSGKSPFTYIIVDRETNTRTCIHTPGEPFTAEEMTPELVEKILNGASAVYFDGRLAEAAGILARGARERGIPVLVEAERLRPGLDILLQYADYVVTSAHFPQEWTGKEHIGDAMVDILRSLPYASWIITTLGSKGALLLERTDDEAEEDAGHGAETNAGGLSVDIDKMFNEAKEDNHDGLPFVILDDGKGTKISSRSHVTSAPFTALGTGQSPESDRLRREAAEKAAIMNADSGESGRYIRGDVLIAGHEFESGDSRYIMSAVPAADIPQCCIVDTTGAGDAFIGTMLFAIASGMSPVNGATLGCLVAAVKCTKLGARPGLPRISDIHNFPQ